MKRCDLTLLNLNNGKLLNFIEQTLAERKRRCEGDIVPVAMNDGLWPCAMPPAACLRGFHLENSTWVARKEAEASIIVGEGVKRGRWATGN